jgi:hypothetical protein
MSTDKRLAHFVLQTGQLPALRVWYLRVLHLELLETVERAPVTVGLAHSTSGPRRVEAK